MGIGVTYTYDVSSSGAIVAPANYTTTAFGTSNPTRITLANNAQKTYTVMVNATNGVGTVSSSTSGSVTTLSPITSNVYNTISATSQIFYYTFEPSTINVPTSTTGVYTSRTLGNMASGTAIYDANFWFAMISSVLTSTAKGGSQALSVTTNGTGMTMMWPTSPRTITIGFNASISIWIYMTSSYTPTGQYALSFGGNQRVSQVGNGVETGSFGFNLLINSTTNFTWFSSGYANSTATTLSASNFIKTQTSIATTIPSGTMNNSQWHHYVITATGTGSATTNGTIKVYYDGALLNSNSAFAYPYNNQPFTSTWNSYFAVGGSVENGNYFYSSGIRANFDNIRFYGRILTADEIATLYTYGS